LGTGEKRHLAVAGKPSAASTVVATTIAVVPPFMSVDPGPYSLPSLSGVLNGSKLHDSGRRVDVEMAVEKQRARALPVPGPREDIGRAGCAGVGIAHLDAGFRHSLAEYPAHRRELRDIAPQRLRRHNCPEEADHFVGALVDIIADARFDFGSGHCGSLPPVGTY
jgi:hypothetical protein